ncbi:MAG: META domain-containing protein [Bacteroidales bacterium]|nr:META domain-containing protein [Bacteroidales bacterium]
MRTYVLLILLFPAIVSSSCKKDLTNEVDITQSLWIVKSIKTDKEQLKPDHEYILEFLNDSLFNLNLSVNSGGGKYKLVSKGNILIDTFDPYTEICCENDFDNSLLYLLPKVIEYEVLRNILIFKSSEGEIEFKKE